MMYHKNKTLVKLQDRSMSSALDLCRLQYSLAFGVVVKIIDSKSKNETKKKYNVSQN